MEVEHEIREANDDFENCTATREGNVRGRPPRNARHGRMCGERLATLALQTHLQGASIATRSVTPLRNRESV